MSGKKVQLKYDEKRGWWLSWGRETFYRDDRTMRTWETPGDAIKWLQINHPELRVTVLDETPKSDQDDLGDIQMDLF